MQAKPVVVRQVEDTDGWPKQLHLKVPTWLFYLLTSALLNILMELIWACLASLGNYGLMINWLQLAVAYLTVLSGAAQKHPSLTTTTTATIFSYLWVDKVAFLLLSYFGSSFWLLWGWIPRQLAACPPV